MTTKKTLRIDPNEHAARALSLIASWGWLRPLELGRLIYGEDKHARKYAEALVRKLVALRLVLARPLPGRHAGTAYVLATRGAEQLNEWSGGEGGYRSGKDWGSIKEGQWSPPASWRHDLLAAGVLSHLAARGLEVLPERLLRTYEPDAAKHPDGVVVARSQGHAFWLEVEHSRKSGANMDALVEALVKASRREPVVAYDLVQDTPVAYGMVAIDPAATDERGFKVNHWERIEAAIKRRGLKAPVRLVVAWIKRQGLGVAGITLELKAIAP